MKFIDLFFIVWLFIKNDMQIVVDQCLIDELFDSLEITEKLLLIGVFMLHEIKTTIR